MTSHLSRLKRPLLWLLPYLLSLAAHAQTTTISGTVRDGRGQALPGANVFLKTTFEGTSTDSLGRFRFTTHLAGTLPLVSPRSATNPWSRLCRWMGRRTPSPSR